MNSGLLSLVKQLKNLTTVMIILPLAVALTSCGSSDSASGPVSEFDIYEYPAHAYECELNDLYRTGPYDAQGVMKKLRWSSTDLKLVEKYPEILEYSSFNDSWETYLASDGVPRELDRNEVAKCKRWLDSLNLTIPQNTNYESAWQILNRNLTLLRGVIDNRVKISDEMYSLVPLSVDNKTQRDRFFSLLNDYDAGIDLAYKSHIAIREILETSNSNGLDYWIALCPTYLDTSDIVGSVEAISEDGAIFIWNHTNETKTFAGKVAFQNGDGIVVASQSINVTIPAGKQFNQKLNAVKGNDNYNGNGYPVNCVFNE
jgi:hypothetical protein